MTPVSSSFFRDIVLRFSGEDNNLSKTVAGIDSKAKAAKVGIADIGKVASATGGALTKGLTVPITALAAGAVKAAVDYESAFAGVRKTVDMTEEEYDRLYDATVKLSGEQPVSAEQLFAIEEMAGQLGISNDKLLDFSQTVAGLDIATNLSAEDAATEMARFINITGESQDNVSNLGSALVDLGNNYATTESEIMAMSMRLAAGTTSVHIGADETLGLAAAMSSLGIEAEAGGSSVSTVLAKLDKAVAKGGKGLDEFASVSGMSAEQFATAWREDPMAAFEAFIVGLGQVEANGGNLNLVLEDLGITELRQVDALKRLSGGWESVGGAIDTATEAYDSNTALQNEVDKRNETTQAKIETLRNRVQNAAAEIGGPLAEALVNVIDTLDPVITAVSDAAEWFNSLDDDTQGFIVTVGGIAAATGPALSAVGEIADNVTKVRDAFGNLKDKMGEVNDAKLDSASSAIGDVAGKATSAETGLTNAVSAAGNLNKIDESTAVQRIEDVGTSAVSVADDDIPKITDAADDVDAIKMDNAEDAFGEVGKASSDAADVIDGTDGIVSAANKVDDDVELPDAEKAFTAVGDASTTAAGVIDGEGGIVDAAAKVDADVDLKNAVDKIDDVAEAATDVATDDLPKITDAAKTVDANVDLDTAKTSVKDVGDAADTAGDKVGGLRGALSMVSDIGIMLAIGMVVSEIAAIVGEMEKINDLSGGVSGALSAIGDADITPDGLEDLSGVIDKINEGAEGAIEDYSEYVKDTTKSLQGIDKDAAALDVYIGIIDSLGEKSELSAVEQEQLKQAVEGFNDIVGESTLTIDEQTGRLEQSKTAVHELADEWEETARRTAVTTAYQDSLVQMAQLEAQVKSLEDARERMKEGHWELDAFGDWSFTTLDFDEAARWDAVNKNLEEARAAYQGAAASTEYLGQQMEELGTVEQAASQTTEETTNSTNQATAAAEGMRAATEEEADALSWMSDHVKNVTSAVDGLDEGLKRAISESGQSVLEFGFLIESTGGSIERFGNVYKTLMGAGDPFSEVANSLPIVDGQARTLSGDLISIEDAAGSASRSTQEMFDTINDNKQVIDDFDEVVRELYGQAQTEEDIAFVDSLVERGPAALGELQNIAGTYEAADHNLHELADAQAAYEKSVTDATINAELERIAANIRVMGDEMLGTQYVVDDATGNIVAVVGEGADQMAYMFDRSTGEIIGVLDSSSPEAQAAAAKMAESAADGVEGASDDFAEQGEQAAQSLADGLGEGSGEVDSAAGLLGEDAKGAIEQMPDEMEARGKVAGWSLGSGLGSQVGPVSTAAGNLVGAADGGLAGIGDMAWDKGRLAGSKLRLGLSSMYDEVNTAGSTIADLAIKGMDGKFSDAEKVGKAITLGLAYGIADSEAVGAVKKAAVDAVNAAVAASKEAGKIRSPSRVMKKVGEFWGEGLALGIEESARRVSDSAYRVMAATAPDKVAAGGTSNAYNVNVTLDYSAGADANQMAADITRALRTRIRQGV